MIVVITSVPCSAMLACQAVPAQPLSWNKLTVNRLAWWSRVTLKRVTSDNGQGARERMKRRSDLAVVMLGATLAGLVMVVVAAAFGPLPSAILSISPAAAKLSPAETVQAEDDIRNSLLQAVGGIVIAAGAITAWRQLVISRRQYVLSRRIAVTDAFSKGIEQLSATETALRLGGIYSLACSRYLPVY